MLAIMSRIRSVLIVIVFHCVCCLAAFSKDLLYRICVKILSGLLVSRCESKKHILLHSSPLDPSAPLVSDDTDRYRL